MILVPGGMYLSKANNSWYCWILGYKSSIQYYIIPAICLSWLCMVYRGKKIQFFVLCLVSAYQAIFSQNAMLIAGLAGMLCIYLLRLFRYEKIFNMQMYLIAIFVVNIVYIFFTPLIISNSWVVGLLSFFGKNLTLSSRLSVILPNTVEAIGENWMIGHGVLPTQWRVTMYNSMKAAIHSHNQVLEVAFVGGIVLLAAYVLLNLVLQQKLMQHKRLESSKVFALSIFVFYIMMLVEIFTRSVGGPIWCVILLAYYCDRVDYCMRQRKDCILS